MNKLQAYINRILPNRRAQIIALVSLTLIAGFLLGNLGGDRHSDHGDETSGTRTDEPGKETIWTCSMHPQIKLPKPGKCPICFMDLIPLDMGSSAKSKPGTERQLVLSESAKRLASIVSVPAIRRSGSSEIKLLGKVAVDESRIETISMRIGGRIDKLFVDFTGMVVRKGDPLASVYSPELISVQQELLSAMKAANDVSPDASELVRSNAQGLFSATKDKLRLLGFSESDLSQILSRGTPSDHMTIRSSQSGVVLEKMATVGSYVMPEMPLFKIADLSRVWVNLDAYESDLQWLRTGQKVSFTIEAYPGETFSGTISFIDAVIDPMTRTVKVRVESDNRGGRLKPEMFVNATVQSASADTKQAKGKAAAPVMIPATAPLLTGERAIVYVELSSDSAGTTYEGREVVLGPKTGDYYIVKSGIEEGERVVVNGAFRIDSELQIRAKPSMMNPQGGVPATGHEGHGSAQPQQNTTPSEHAGHETSAAQSEGDKSVAPSKLNLSDRFIKDLEAVYGRYFTVSKLLSQDKFKEAKKEMAAFGKFVSGIQVDGGKQYSSWSAAAGEIRDALAHVNHAAGISGLREIYGKISQQVITLEKQYGHASGEHYLAFCPMAFNNKGAYWVQTEQQIANPYFGASMLRCGEIKETFKARDSGAAR